MTQQRPAHPGPSNAGSPRPPARLLGPHGALLPLRVFAGGTFLYAGLDKLLTPGFLAASGPGSIGEQLDIFVRTSPLAPFVRAFALPAPTLIGLFMALAEIAIGLGVLSGLLFRTAAAAGAAVAGLFWLTASWTTHPYYYGPDLPYLFGFATLALAGHGGLFVLGPTLDRWLRPVEGRAPTGAPASAPARVANGSRPGRDGRPVLTGTPERVPARAPEPGPEAVVGRRELLQAGLVGGTAVALATTAGVLGRVGGGTGTGGGVPAGTSPGPSSGAQSGGASAAASAPAASTPASSATAGGPVITNLSQVAKGSAIDFTLPTTGDPGVLVRLRDGTVAAYDAVCTHQGCTVGYDSGSGLLLCPCHGAVFDPSNSAAVLAGPARTPLAAVALVVDQKTGEIRLAG